MFLVIYLINKIFTRLNTHNLDAISIRGISSPPPPGGGGHFHIEGDGDVPLDRV